MLKQYSVAQKSGSIVAVLSIAWIFFLSVEPAFRGLARMSDWMDGVFGVSLFVLVGVPGLLLLIASIRLMRDEPTRHLVKNVFGGLAALTALFGAFALAVYFSALVGEASLGFYFFWALFCTILCVLPIYVGVSKYVMRCSGIAPIAGEFLGRGTFQILAFLLWLILWGMVQNLGILERQLPDDVAAQYYGLIRFLAPILVPYFLYTLALKYLVRDTDALQVELDVPSV